MSIEKDCAARSTSAAWRVTCSDGAIALATAAVSIEKDCAAPQHLSRLAGDCPFCCHSRPIGVAIWLVHASDPTAAPLPVWRTRPLLPSEINDGSLRDGATRGAPKLPLRAAVSTAQRVEPHPIGGDVNQIASNAGEDAFAYWIRRP